MMLGEQEESFDVFHHPTLNKLMNNAHCNDY